MMMTNVMSSSGIDHETGHVHDLVQPHIDSFDWLLRHGLDLIVKYLHPVDVAANPDTNRPACRLAVKQIRYYAALQLL